MRIYTRTGDAGTTGLRGGSRIAKDSLRIAAIGGVDELNAALGLARSLGGPAEIDRLQSWLFSLGAELALPHGKESDGLDPRRTAWLEGEIDTLMAALPPLRAFILPGGTPAASAVHVARSVCRRAERSVLALHALEPVDANVLAFFNRLSDYLFALARSLNAAADVPDVEWHPEEAPC